MKKYPQNTVARLILYRKILKSMDLDANSQTFSHVLASLAGSTAAQVRRDLMQIGYKGTPVHGYNVFELKKCLDEFLDRPLGQKAIIVGLGNLGRAILDYCHGRNPALTIVYAFDKDPQKIGRVINGTHCYDIAQLNEIIKLNSIELAILAIPDDQSQEIANRLIQAGIKGFLNYSAIRLSVPANIYVENRDMMQALEKVAFYVNKNAKK
jgi:redox-sensing transcriptional repressor